MYVSNTQHASHRASGGFTLVELMVTVAIVAILMSIAVPSYSLYMKQSRRGETESALMDIAQRQQAYLLDQRSYATTVAALNTSVSSDVTTYYTVNICAAPPPAACAAPAGGAISFVAVAAPIAGTAQAGDYTLAIDNTGAKTAYTSAGATVPNIW